MATATATAAPTTLEAAKNENKFNSVRAMNAALASNGANEWGGGLPADKYSDCYTATGSLETFPTRKTADLSADKQKIGGRYVMNAAGQKRKLYNGFMNLISSEVKGVTKAEVTHNGETVTFTSLDSAHFGIKATDTGTKRNPEDEYTEIKHELILPARSR